MEDIKLKQLWSKNPELVNSILDEFNSKNSNLFDFAPLHNDGDQWHSLWRAVFAILGDVSLAALHPLCLNTVRILTRDEFSLQTHDIEAELTCLLKLAHLSLTVNMTEMFPYSVEEEEEDDVEEGAACSSASAVKVYVHSAQQTIVEALKCLCNLVFQSPACRRPCIKATDGILKRVASPMQHPCSVELYDMKLLFLITALEPTARNRVQIDLNGLAYMTEWLDDKLSDLGDMVSDEQLDLLGEILKVMFTITSSPDKSPNENEIQSLHLTVVIRELLLRFGAMVSERERCVVMHAINLLTNIASVCLTELMTKYELTTAAEETRQQLIFEGRNVRVLEILLRYLSLLLQEPGAAAACTSTAEHIPPVLTVLLKCARCPQQPPTMRHYIRSVVLPPLRDVSQRPEVGNELRNHLCRFLTMPAMLERDLAAELLFVCCKENVGRMIKYTGYGNAAGLFAKRGILDLRRQSSSVAGDIYSSDSEDSDTEEYKQLQHTVNPVHGCYEAPPKIDAFAGMSEEQKEFEAMQLVQLMDQLQRSGVVQPCRIGEDGKPQPVEHIMQLQEELPSQQFDLKRKT